MVSSKCGAVGSTTWSAVAVRAATVLGGKWVSWWPHIGHQRSTRSPWPWRASMSWRIPARPPKRTGSGSASPIRACQRESMTTVTGPLPKRWRHSVTNFCTQSAV
jgi:hypothetical protein